METKGYNTGLREERLNEIIQRASPERIVNMMRMKQDRTAINYKDRVVWRAMIANACDRYSTWKTNNFNLGD